MLDETFEKINEILNRQINILPCPICGYDIRIVENDSDYLNWFTFECENSECGFSYHPSNNEFKRNEDKFQKNYILNHCIE